MSISFKCAACGKAFRVKDELAGKKAKCSCGASVVIPKPATASPTARAAAPKAQAAAPSAVAVAPATRPAPADDDLFDEAMAEATKACPSCKNTVKHDAVLCVKCGYNFRERKIQATELVAAPAPTTGTRCSKCGSRNSRKVNDNEYEAFKDRTETSVAIGRPLICNDCGQMWEPPASLSNYFASYAKSVAIFVAGVVVTVITCAVVWSVFARVDADGEVALRFSARRMAALLKGNYPVIAVVLFGLSLMGAGIWGVLRTLIVQMGWKGVLYDPDENKW